MKRIDLIPHEAKRMTSERWLGRRLFKSRASFLITLAVIAFIGINLWRAAAILRYQVAIAFQKKEIAAIQSKLTASQRSFAQIKEQRADIDREIRRLQGKIDILQGAQGESLPASASFDAIARLAPDALWADKITLKKDAATIAGATADNAIISDFMKKLDASGRFRDTTFTYTQKAKLADTPVMDYEITTHIASERSGR